MGTQQLAWASGATPRYVERSVSSKWIAHPGILAFCFGPTLMVAISLWLSGSDIAILVGQTVLSLGTFCAFWILDERPLIDPIQAVVFLFHWWFAVGPATCSVFYLLTEESERAQRFLTGSPTALLIVAFGLPLYALVALGVMRAWPEEWYAGFLRPTGDLYRPRTITIWIAAGLFFTGVVAMGKSLGVYAFDELNYLGGRNTSSPVMAVIAYVGERMASFAALGLIGYAVRPGQRKRWLLWLMVGISWMPAIFSGSKGPIMLTLFYVVVARFMLNRRLPILLLLVSVVLYLGIVQPFVDRARLQSEIHRAQNSEQRNEIFQQVLVNGEFFPKTWSDVAIGSPFRGIYVLAQQISDLSGLTEGPWEGESIRTGILTLAPRVLYADKPDMNIGHFFALQLAAPAYQNEMHNVSITLPFEFVGNYGWLPGIISFAIIGLGWTALTLWILSPARLSTHPLMPWLLSIAMLLEGNVGQFLNSIKDLPFAMVVILGIWLSSKRQL